MPLTTLGVRDMVAAYKDGVLPVVDILRYHRVAAKTLYYHLDQAGVPRRNPQRPRLEVGEVVDVSLHVLPCFPVSFVARPGERPLPEASLPADSGALVASRASDSLAQPGEEGSMRKESERLTQAIADATAPGQLSAADALEVMEEVSSWLEGSIEALRGEIEEGVDAE